MDPNNRTSSVYSDSSSRKPLHVETRMNAVNGSSSRPSSRATSYTPSYMSNLATKAPNGQVARSSPIPVSQTPSQTTPSKHSTASNGPAGVLLVFSPGELHPEILHYIEVLLEGSTFNSIVFAASTAQEADLKQLKMNVFALLGKMQREVAVNMVTQDEWTETQLEASLQDHIKSGQELRGVLCCFEPGEQQDYRGREDILRMDNSQLDQAWKQSVAVLQMVSGATTSRLLASSKAPGQLVGQGTRERRSGAPDTSFLLVTKLAVSTAAMQITKAAFDAYMDQLERVFLERDLTFGFAEYLLIPEPKPAISDLVDESVLRASKIPPAAESTFTPSESPTKLWNMWSLMNDTPTFDS